jgi:hypothetical protein
MVTHKIIMGTEVITGGRAGIEAVEVVPEASDMAAVDAAAAIAKIREQLAASGGQKATRWISLRHYKTAWSPTAT